MFLIILLQEKVSACSTYTKNIKIVKKLKFISLLWLTNVKNSVVGDS